VLEMVLLHGNTHRALMDRIPDQPKSVNREKKKKVSYVMFW